MDDLLNKLLGLIPAKYHATVLLLALASPYLTRAWHALSTGGGVRGIINAIWFGTNTPKTPAQK